MNVVIPFFKPERTEGEEGENTLLYVRERASACVLGSVLGM